jgi:hypothetical protein
LITWLQRNYPTATPRLRVESAQPGTPAPAPTDSQPTDLERDRHARLFGESLDGNTREQQFSGPPQEEQRTEAVQPV